MSKFLLFIDYFYHDVSKLFDSYNLQSLFSPKIPTLEIE
jgi:hypothetical protein